MALQGAVAAFVERAKATEPVVFVNGKRLPIPDGKAEMTLLQFLRDRGLTGTKLGCGEGGCGACTVMVSRWDPTLKKPTHSAVNACLAPLYSVEGAAVVTVEGLGSTRTALHPVQRSLSSSHGSQCGFCTPGFVMSMYALLRSKSPEKPSEHDIEEALAGNLCRCTGYRPILDAFRVFAKTDEAAYHADARLAAAKEGLEGVADVARNGPSGIPNGTPNGTANGTANGHHTPLTNGHANGEGAVELSAAYPAGQKLCPSTGKPCDCFAAKTPAPDASFGGPCAVPSGVNGLSSQETKAALSAEPIFPPELTRRPLPPLHLTGEGGSQWFRPTSVAELLALKAQYPEAKIVVGNSEVGVEMKFKNLRYPVFINVVGIPEVCSIQESEQGLDIGAAAPLSTLHATVRAAVASKPKHQTAACAAIAEQLKWFAGVQIRNVASVGGNVCTASPISDLNPIWMASRAVFRLAAASKDGGPPVTREVPAESFFLGYRKVDLLPGEVMTSVFLPWTRELEFVKEFKQAHRKDDDIALVNAGMRVLLTPPPSSSPSAAPTVAEVALAFGGVAAKSVRAPKTEAFLLSKPWTEDTLTAALQILQEDIVVPDAAPGGMPQFRRSLTASFLFKFFLHAAYALPSPSAFGSLPESYRSAVEVPEKPLPRGIQVYEVSETGEAVGAPVVHQSADVQVTGEAQYADDVPLPADGLHGALVLSTRPHAKILGIDTSAAEAMPGYAGFFGAKDVPGSNVAGAVVHDEEFFASEKVSCVGHLIGVVVADSHDHAKAAAKAVKISYEDLPPVYSIDEAIAAQQFYAFPFTTDKQRVLQRGDVEAAFQDPSLCEYVVEGVARMGAQEQFYLEPNSCLCWTVDGGREVHAISSTQAPTHHQKDMSLLLGLPLHRVVCKTKRLGGGFGGKETRAMLTNAAAALAAFKLNRAVRVTLDRDDDMGITGQRHPFQGKYKVGVNKAGKIAALDLEIYCNAGNSVDLSFSVLERACFHSDNVYAIPHMRVTGRMAATNLPSNTAYRGFGGPQGMLIVEQWVDHIARTLGMPPETLRELNLQDEGWELHYGQKLERSQVQRVWSELKKSSDFEARRVEVDAYNAQHRWRKRGLAMIPTKFGISFTAKHLNQGAALVHVYTDGTVLVSHGGVEMGQGLHTKVAQVVASSFGIPVSSVFVSETATDKIPNTSPTAASASSDLYCQAAINACEQLKERMKPIKEANPKDSFPELANKCYMERVNLSANGFYATPNIGFDWASAKGVPFAYFTFGGAVAEVEIDTLTGDVTVPRVDILMDLGRSLNPAIDVGQIEGAFAQGFGWSVIEEMKWGDREHPWVRPGMLFTQGPGNYKIPSVNDVPLDFRVSLLKGSSNPRAVLSSKAVGEPPLFLGSSVMWAIKDAVYAARKDAGITGHFVLDTPATPERIRMACADQFTKPFADPDIRPLLSC